MIEKLRHSKRIELLFTYIGINSSHDIAKLKNERLIELCRQHQVNKNIVREIANGNIKINK